MKKTKSKYREKVAGLFTLAHLAKTKKSVEIKEWDFRILPAAFVINLQGSLIMKLLKSGIYVYKKGDPND